MSYERDLSAAFAAYQTGNIDLALNRLVPILENNPDLAKAHQLFGQIATQTGQLPQAQDAFGRALKYAPDDPEILNAAANFYKMTGRFGLAEMLYDKALAKAPGYLAPILQLGELYLQWKDPLKAADLFREALKYHDNHPTLLQGLLTALKDSSQTEAALSMLERFPSIPQTALIAGELYATLGQFKPAKAAFEAAMQAEPIRLIAYRHLLRLISQAKGLSTALITAEAKIEETPDTLALYVLAADLCISEHAYPHAVALLDQAEARFGQHVDSLHLRALIAIDQHDADQAYNFAEQCISMRPGNAAILSTYAKAALMANKADKAEQTARSFISVQPGNPFWQAIYQSAQPRPTPKDTAQTIEPPAVMSYVRQDILPPPPEYKDRLSFLSQLEQDLSDVLARPYIALDGAGPKTLKRTPDLRFTARRTLQDLLQTLKTPIKAYLAPDSPLQELAAAQMNTGAYRFSRIQAFEYGTDSPAPELPPEGWLRGLYYIRAPKDIATTVDRPGWLKLGHPDFLNNADKPQNWLTPTDGLFILYPAQIWASIHMPEKAWPVTQPFLMLQFDIIPT